MFHGLILGLRLVARVGFWHNSISIPKNVLFLYNEGNENESLACYIQYSRIFV